MSEKYKSECWRCKKPANVIMEEVSTCYDCLKLVIKNTDKISEEYVQGFSKWSKGMNG